MRNLETAIKVVVGKVADDCRAYKRMPEYRLASVPLTRRERRALKRKEKKFGKSSYEQSNI